MEEFNRDPREFDSSEFFLGIAILLYSFGHWIGGTVCLSLAILIWIMYKIFSKYVKEKENDQNKHQ